MSSGSDSEHQSEPDDADQERTAIRTELSSLSFEQLQQLKERLGAKVYREALFGAPAAPAAPKVFKRENKNRPREMSSKKPVSLIRESDAVRKKKELRDPRFDPLCGEFDKKTFKETYSFLNDVRERDAASLRAELKVTSEPERQQTLRLLLQRLENQAREEKRGSERREARRRERETTLAQLKQGKKPEFVSKSERRVLDLVSQYEELQKSGRLQKHIEKRRKKSTQKARKRQLAPPTASHDVM